MMDTFTCPSDLRNVSKEDRLRYFDDQLIKHEILRRVDKALMNAIRQPCGYSLILVYGPTGVGKTTLQKHVHNALVEDFLASNGQNPGYIPVINMEVIPPGTQMFSWKTFYKGLLAAADEPLINYKIDLNAHGIKHNKDGKLIIGRSTTEADLRVAVEHCLKYRGLNAVILDEAHHLGKVSPSRMQDQMDVIKSLANATETILVLIGTYELLKLTNLSGQLSRRSLSIHFEPYEANVNGIKAIVNAVGSFCDAMPFNTPPTLVNYVEYLYSGSAGCVGLLKQWLTRAVWAALDENAPTVTYQHLEQTIMPQRERLRIAEEIEYGRRVLSETKDQEDRIRRLIGLDELDDEVKDAAEIKKRRGKPGIRKDPRDPVGPYA
jgi:Cdc6-like AAA superfamily ATPase